MKNKKKSKVTLFNAPVHLIMDLIDTYKTMDIKRWRTQDTLAIAITFIFAWSFYNMGKLLSLILTHA